MNESRMLEGVKEQEKRPLWEKKKSGRGQVNRRQDLESLGFAVKFVQI